MPEGKRAAKGSGKTTHFMTAELRRQPLRNQNKPLNHKYPMYPLEIEGRNRLKIKRSNEYT